MRDADKSDETVSDGSSSNTAESPCNTASARTTLASAPRGPAGGERPREPEQSEPVSEDRIPREIPVRLGRYLIDGLIGCGGMGIVYKARQAGLNRPVALKLLLHGEHSSAEGRRRFEREAKAIAKLRHPNIVSVHEVGDYKGQPFFTMDYIDGLSLTKYVARVPFDSQKDIALLCSRLADAVDYAHEQGVIHRDLKPDNILMTASGEPVITDFGLAKDMESMSMLSMSGEVMGTPAFMPPEQASGRIAETDRRSDVYGLGAILYWLLTRHEPFEGRTVVETLSCVANEDPPLVTKINPSVDADLCAICLKAMEKDKRLRYQSAAELAYDLRRFLKGYPVHAKPWSWRRATGRFIARHRWAVASGVAAVAAIVAAAILSVAIFSRSYLEIASKRLVSPDPAVRAAALQDLGREVLHPESLKPDDMARARALLAGMSADRDELVLRAWLEFLAEHGAAAGIGGSIGAEQSRRLIEVADRGDKPAERNLAIAAIGKIRREEFVDYLIRRLGEPNPSIRMLIVRSLGEQRSSKAIGPLINIVTGDSLCRAEAKAALDLIYRDGRVAFFDGHDRAVKTALRDLTGAMASYDARLEELLDEGVAGARQPKGPFDESAKALASADPALRIKAVYELGLTGDKRAAALLMGALNDPDADVGAAAAMAIAQVDPEGQLDTLRKNLSADSPALRGNSALALGYAKKKDDLDPLLVALAQENDLTVKKRLVRGIGELGLSAAIPGLKAAAMNDPGIQPEVDIILARLK